MSTENRFEYEFELPYAYEDANGNRYETVRMRKARAADEILPLKDHRVYANPAYLVIILLSRVLSLDGKNSVSTKVIEDLPAGDLAFLQDMYRRLNHYGYHNRLVVKCPHCEQMLAVEMEAMGGA